MQCSFANSSMATGVANFQDIRHFWSLLDAHKSPDALFAVTLADKIQQAAILQRRYLAHQSACTPTAPLDTPVIANSNPTATQLVRLLSNSSAQANPPSPSSRGHFRRNTLEKLYSQPQQDTAAESKEIQVEFQHKQGPIAGPATPDIADKSHTQERTPVVDVSQEAHAGMRHVRVHEADSVDTVSPKAPKSARFMDAGVAWEHQQETRLLDLPDELLDVIFAKCHPKQQLVVTSSCRKLQERWLQQRIALLDMVFPPISMTLAGQFTMFDGYAATLQLRIPERDPSSSIHQARLVDRLYSAACPSTLTYTSIFVTNNTVRCTFPATIFEPTTRTLQRSNGAIVQIYTGRRGFEGIDVILVPVVRKSMLTLQLYVAGLQRLEPQDEVD